jgi:hypothetical protein
MRTKWEVKFALIYKNLMSVITSSNSCKMWVYVRQQLEMAQWQAAWAEGGSLAYYPQQVGRKAATHWAEGGSLENKLSFVCPGVTTIMCMWCMTDVAMLLCSTTHGATCDWEESSNGRDRILGNTQEESHLAPWTRGRRPRSSGSSGSSESSGGKIWGLEHGARWNTDYGAGGEITTNQTL